jgi:hypothetical protein
LRSKALRKTKQLKKLDMKPVKKPRSEQEEEFQTKSRFTYNDIDLDCNDVSLVL